MTLRFLPALFLLAATSAFAAEPKNAYEPGKIWQIHLTISPAEWAAMQPQGRGFFGGGGPAAVPKPPEKKEGPVRDVHKNTFGVDLPWVNGSLAIDDKTYREVRLRYKGNGTVSDASKSIKKSIKIDLDFFDEQARFHSAKAINLHCGVADPSKCRESLGYGLYRAAGVPAARTAFAEVRVTVPGKHDRELLGLYTLVEDADKAFLKTHFGRDDGLLMKPEGVRELEDKGDDWKNYVKTFEPKREATPDEAKRVIAFVRLVQKSDDATFQKEIASYLDIDAYLRFLAATAYVSNSDSFFSLGHNYYAYLHPKTKRFHFFPWDLDRAFSNLPILGSNDQQMNLSFAHPYGGTHKLNDRVMALPGVREKYQTLLKELAAGAFEASRVSKQLETMEATIKDLVAADAKALTSRKEPAIAAMPGGFTLPKPPSLKVFIEKRTKSLALQIDGKSKGHIPEAFGMGGFKVGGMLAGPMLENRDTDADGLLSKDEWLATAKRLFEVCVKDDKGGVNEKAVIDGLTALFPKPAEGDPVPPPGMRPANFLAGPIVRRGDADKDGRLTLEEIVKASTAIFDEHDKSKSGKLDETAFGDLLTTLFPMPKFGGPPKKDVPKKDEPKKE